MRTYRVVDRPESSTGRCTDSCPRQESGDPLPDTVVDGPAGRAECPYPGSSVRDSETDRDSGPVQTDQSHPTFQTYTEVGIDGDGQNG